MAKKSKKFTGRLIVFEGPDGVGKTTQAKLLFKYLKSKKAPVAYISFPRYETSWGKQIKRYLFGDFGNLGDVDPYFVSLLYAGDRMVASGKIKKWLESGKIVICDRYCASNIGHQAARLRTLSQKKNYIDWLENLEYRENKIPREDLVIMLQMPVASSMKLMVGRRLDIHEGDKKYMENVFSVFNYLAGLKNNWVRIDCAPGGNILGKFEIQRQILEILKRKNMIV